MRIVFDSDLPEEGLERLSAALDGLWEGDDLSAELLLVSEEEIRSLNARERGVDRVTDVLSFPSMDGIKGVPILAEEHGEELDEEGRVFLGSVVICEQPASRRKSTDTGFCASCGTLPYTAYCTVSGMTI